MTELYIANPNVQTDTSRMPRGCCCPEGRAAMRVLEQMVQISTLPGAEDMADLLAYLGERAEVADTCKRSPMGQCALASAGMRAIFP